MTTSTPAPFADRHAKIRARNDWDNPRRAGTELLIRTGWTERGVWVNDDGYIDPTRMTDEYIGAYSGGEQRLLRVAASLLGGEPVDLHYDLCGIDEYQKQQIMTAMAWALGQFDLVAKRWKE